jgi:hypothetical protein
MKKSEVDEKTKLGGRLISRTVAIAMLICVMSSSKAFSSKKPVLRQSEVVFMYAADSDAYRAYDATFVAWGGANTPEQVKRHHDLGIRCTGSMWCLTPGAENIHKNPALRQACAIDIEGKPVEVPWLFDHTYEGTKTYFGCTNHSEFRSLCRQRVQRAMAGKADGLHVDDHLGTAGAAWWQGGGFCNYCMEAFREYLKENATEEQLQQASIRDLDTFDYRTLVRKYATTRTEYKKVQRKIPLMDLFLDFHVKAAAEHTRQLGLLASEVVGRSVLLSANACIPNKAHEYVIRYLTHVVCEVGQNAAAGTEKIEHAIAAYKLATRLGKPLAATASGWDWAYVKEHRCEELVRFWIALAYAHGQRFMVPHPKRQWCFNNERGTHWYAAPIEEFAPLYQFIRANARWFDEFEGVDTAALDAPENVLCTVRRRADSSQVVLHVLNLDYDRDNKRMKPVDQVKIGFKKSLIPDVIERARILSYDSAPRTIPVKEQDGAKQIVLPELKIWSLVVFE